MSDASDLPDEPGPKPYPWRSVTDRDKYALAILAATDVQVITRTK